MCIPTIRELPYMTDFLKIAKSIVVHFAHICAYGVETVNADETGLWWRLMPSKSLVHC